MMDKQQLDKQLAMYSAAAAVTLAGTAAHGALQYTPANITVEAGNPYKLNFDGDYKHELTLFVSNYFQAGSIQAQATVGVANVGNNIAEKFTMSNDLYYAAANQWTNGGFQKMFGRTSGGSFKGNFSNGGYIGVRFRIISEYVYGWVSIAEVDTNTPSFKINGYAYEDSGNEIHIGSIPEPSGLALLAMGAAGVHIFRRKKQNS